MVVGTDYGHPERAFFQKFEIFGLGQTNWAENLWGIWAISGQTISTILALWVPYPWESVAGPLSYKKLWFLGLKHITPKYSQNKIWAVQNLENSVRTSVFGVCTCTTKRINCRHYFMKYFSDNPTSTLQKSRYVIERLHRINTHLRKST